MKQTTLARLLFYAVPTLGAVLLALLLAACTLPMPVRPPPGWSPLPTPPPPPLVGSANPALVGFYRGSALLPPPRVGAPFTSAITITLSLFQDGTFEETFDVVSDTGTRTEPNGLQRAAGRWADQGDHAVLTDQRGPVASFMTIGGDALAFTPAQPGSGTQTWMLTRVSTTPEHFFAASVRNTMRAALEDNRRAVIPALSGVYRSAVQFMPETGDAAFTLQLFPNGWAELAFDRVQAPGEADDDWTGWGLWSASGDSAAALTVALYGTEDSFGAAQVIAGAPVAYTFGRNGDTVTQVVPAWGFVLTRTATLPAPLLPALFPAPSQ